MTAPKFYLIEAASGKRVRLKNGKARQVTEEQWLKEKDKLQKQGVRLGPQTDQGDADDAVDDGGVQVETFQVNRQVNERNPG